VFIYFDENYSGCESVFTHSQSFQMLLDLQHGHWKSEHSLPITVHFVLFKECGVQYIVMAVSYK
jgi:hypothetical protein